MRQRIGDQRADTIKMDATLIVGPSVWVAMNTGLHPILRQPRDRKQRHNLHRCSVKRLEDEAAKDTPWQLGREHFETFASIGSGNAGSRLLKRRCKRLQRRSGRSDFRRDRCAGSD